MVLSLDNGEIAEVKPDGTVTVIADGVLKPASFAFGQVWHVGIGIPGLAQEARASNERYSVSKKASITVSTDSKFSIMSSERSMVTPKFCSMWTMNCRSVTESMMSSKS